MPVPRRRRGSLAATLMLTAGLCAPASPAAAAAPITLDIVVGTTCIGGRDTRSGDPLIVTLLGPDGRRRDRGEAYVSEGNFHVCLDVRVRSGDRIRVVQGAIDRTVRVPNLTISVDRATDVIRGTAPRSRPLTLVITPCLVPDGASCSGAVSFPASSTDEGRYRRDLTSLRDVIGGDQVIVAYMTPGEDRFMALAYAPSFQVSEPGKAAVSCPPGDGHRVTLRRADGSLKGSASFGDSGACTLSASPIVNRRFRRTDRPVDVAVGNILRSSIASDAQFRWPEIRVDRSADGAIGRCFPTSRFRVEVFRSSGGELTRVGSTSGITLGDGSFFRPSGVSFAVLPGDRLRLLCQTHRGDRAVTALTLVD